MNNDILREILKYVNSSVEHEAIDRMLTCSSHMNRKHGFISKVLEKKLSLRPSLEDLKDKKIVKTEEDIKRFVIIREQVDKALQISRCTRVNYPGVAPSISNLVKKLDFEYKKIIIIHKLGLKRVK